MAMVGMPPLRAYVLSQINVAPWRQLRSVWCVAVADGLGLIGLIDVLLVPCAILHGLAK